MPIYEYKCRLCAKVTESIMKPWETKNPVQCPECGGACDRVWSGIGGYTIKGDNSGSERPKHAGSFKTKK